MRVSPNNPPGITDTIYTGAHYVVYSEYTAALPRIARSVRSEAPKHPHEDFQPALNGHLRQAIERPSRPKCEIRGATLRKPASRPAAQR
ncbi:Uncharacterised protein [Mycobacteroides abscessus subsp. abscessus]|nr:Uncharacterised protein [Mycobacteroides abscessus subsp. abscessus]